MKNKIIGGLLCLALGAGFAFAQQSVQQSGTVTAGHVTGWAYNGIVQDGGTTVNPNLTAIGAYGTGDVHCISNTKVRTGGWYNLCLGYATDSSSAYITLTPFGGAANIPLNITADGSSFPIGPGSLSTLLDQQMGSTQGDIIYRNATTWVALPPASSGFLTTNGTGANPSWTPGTSLSAITANSLLANTTASSATPIATSIPSCSASGTFLQYTTSTGFSCGSQAASGTVTSVVCGATTITTTGTCSVTTQPAPTLTGSTSGNATLTTATGTATNTGSGWTYTFYIVVNGVNTLSGNVQITLPWTQKNTTNQFGYCSLGYSLFSAPPGGTASITGVISPGANVALIWANPATLAGAKTLITNVYLSSADIIAGFCVGNT